MDGAVAPDASTVEHHGARVKVCAFTNFHVGFNGDEWVNHHPGSYAGIGVDVG
jgi:hypothetical protein